MAKTKVSATDEKQDAREQVLYQYQLQRHAAHIASENRLDDLAFKTSERYDQWVLTLAGGALAISLTFLEKIAPTPAANTVWLLGLSWLAFIVAILAGFFAIHYSREAIYREIEIARENYRIFLATGTVSNLPGDSPSEPKNPQRARVTASNTTSRSCLALGTALLCTFALINLVAGKASKGPEKEIAVDLHLPQPVVDYLTKTTTGTNMSKDGNKPEPIKPMAPPPPDASSKGVRVGDLAPAKGSYVPTSQQAPVPPPPPPKK